MAEFEEKLNAILSDPQAMGQIASLAQALTGLSLSPVKISGTCGRLMCCLKYEQEAYTDLLKHTPKVGAIVNTPEGRGLVVENNLIAGTLKVKLNNTPEDAAPKSFTVKQCKLTGLGRKCFFLPR